MYGLCKVHKGRGDSNNLPPFRAILSAIVTCTYDIAKVFVPIIKDFTLNEYTVRDSFSFFDEIQEQDNNLYMASFDIKSLFTNIPFDETINICVNNVFGNKKRVKGLLKTDFKQLLTLSIKSSCFVFNNVYYQQVDGVAMGSPLRPTFANLFLVNYESKWLKDCPVQFAPKYYRRYVDNIFLLFKAKDHVQKFFRYMNSRHPKIKFTFEEKNDNKISFLDISITRTENKFATSIFRKKTFSGVYLNFHSHLPTDYKKGLIDTLLHRSYNICTDDASFHQEILFLKSVWQKNYCPLFFIDKCVKKFLDKLFIKKKKIKDSSTKKEIMISLDILGKIYLQVKRQLIEIFRTCNKGIKLNAVFKMSNAFRFKDQIRKCLNSMLL